MESHFVSNVVDYLKYIQEIDEKYPSSCFSNPISKKFLFRGVENYTFDLKPSIYRTHLHVYKDDDCEQVIENDKYLAYAHEKDILFNFKNEAASLLPNLWKESNLRWLEYAQHFGVPTRLLDWTTNPLAALYFACYDGDNDGVVYSLHINNYFAFREKENDEKNIHEPKEESITSIIEKSIAGKEVYQFPLIYIPPYFDIRMSAQSSCFMAWGEIKKSLDEILKDKKVFSNLVSHLGNGTKVFGVVEQESILFKIQISKYDKQRIIRQLDLTGMNEKTLFPGLDGIGKYLERKYRVNYDEIIECI